MPRYIDADALKDRMLNYYECVNADTSKSNYKGETLMNYEVADMIEDCIDNAPAADVVPKAEADEWYHEYHVIKDKLKTEKMYHRETEKLADKYFIECKHLQQMLDAAIAGQEALQQYFLTPDKPDGIMIRYNEKTGKWDKYEPYMTIECPEEKDYEFLQTAIAKQVSKEPLKESLADYGCPTCGAYINFDGLNGKIEHAPKYCSECGQRIDWERSEAK